MKILCHTKSYMYRNYRIYDNGYSYDVYNGPDLLESGLETSSEAEEYIRELAENFNDAEQEIMHTYLVQFINSADKSSSIEVEAKDKEDARAIVKRKLGKECYRIIDVYERN